jgi:hypothetical protein
MTFSERRDILAGLVEIFCQVEERNKRKNNNQKTPLNKAFFATLKFA